MGPCLRLLFSYRQMIRDGLLRVVIFSKCISRGLSSFKNIISRFETVCICIYHKYVIKHDTMIINKSLLWIYPSNLYNEIHKRTRFTKTPSNVITWMNQQQGKFNQIDIFGVMLRSLMIKTKSHDPFFISLLKKNKMKSNSIFLLIFCI